MSKTIDERVVSMEFDNSRFEKNVSTTMSTLDKLKQKLNLSGASKGLENVSDAARRCDISPLSRGVETVKARFSAMEVMAVTALANITNSAVNAGKRLVSAFTIDPIKSGFQEYETQINAIQTILANTESKGTTLEQVNTALDELNKYADKTIYNFTEMTRNIGTFTAAGIDLDTSVSAIQGIANLAAVSGSTSQQASVAMYQLSQALASGTVKLMDWNSVVNAGMGGEVFQNALKKTSELLGTGAEAAIEATGSFRESLSKGWLTAEVLTETLKKFTTSGANEYLAEYTGLSKEFIDSTVESAKAQYGEAEAIEKAAAAIAEKSGKSVDEVRSTLKLAQTAEDAATKVKTFSQLMDTLKESAQSGWTQTWEILIGDFGQAKELFTGISDAVGGFINKMSDSRNELLSGVFGDQSTKSWNSLTKSVNEAGVSTDKFKEKLVELGKSHGVLTDEMVQEAGSFEKTFKQGWLSADIVAEALDSLSNGTIDATKALNEYTVKTGDCLWNIAKEHKTTWQEIYELNKDIINDPNLIYPDQILKLNSVTGESIKLTEEQVKVLQALSKEAQTSGSSMETLIKKMDRPSGRELIIDSFKNFCEYIRKVAAPVKEAWESIFPPKSMEERQEALYKIIESINKFTKKLEVSEGTFGKLKRTFKGLFAILDIIKTVVGGPLVYAFKGICKVLGMVDVDILSVTASVGDAIVAFRDWINEHNLFAKAFEIILPYLEKAADGIKTWFNSLKDSDNIARDFVLGIVNGLKTGVKMLWNAAYEIGKTMYNAVCNVLGIHSPSTEGFKIAYNFILGIINGIKEFAKKLWSILSEFASKWIKIIVEKIKSIDIGKLFAAALGVGLLLVVNKLANVLKSFTGMFDGVGDMLSGIGNAFNGLGKALSGFGAKLKAEAIFKIALAIAVLAASVIALSFIEPSKLWGAIGALAALAVVLTVVSFAMSKMGSIDLSFSDVSKMSIAVIAMSLSLLIMASALKKLSGINVEDIPKTIGLFVTILLGLVGVLAVYSLLTKRLSSGGIGDAGGMLLKISVALLIMVFVIKQISKLDDGAIKKGLGVIALFGLLIVAFIKVSKSAGQYASKAGSMLLKISLAFLIMVGVIKLAGSLDKSEVYKGLSVVAVIGLLFTALIAVSKLAGNNASKAGGMLLKMSLAFLIVTLVIKQISKLDDSEVKRGLGVITVIGLLFTALIAVSKLAGDNAVKAGVMLLAMSFALIILTAVLFIISKMDPDGVYRALGVISALEILFGGLIAVTSLAKDCKATLIILVVAIGILIAALIGLSFIDPSSLKSATLALTAVVGVFALLMYATRFLKTGEKAWKRNLATLTVLSLIVAGLAAVIIALSRLENPNSAIAMTAALSILLAAISGVLIIVSQFGGKEKTAQKGIKSLALIGLVVAELAIILSVMSALNVEASIQTATALSILLATMSGVLVVLSLVGKLSSGAMTGIGAMAVLALVVAELAIILGVMSSLNVEASIQTATALSMLILVMSVALLPLTLVGAFGLAALAGIGVLAVAIAAIGGLIIGIGYLMDKSPELEEFLNKGIPILGKIGYGLGSFFGNIIAGFAGGAMEILPSLGQSMSDFMKKAEGFIIGASSITEDTVTGAGFLAKSIIALTAAQLLSGIASFMTCGLGFAKLGADLSMFMKFAAPFIARASMLNADMMEGVRALAETVLILTAADILNGLTSWLTGGSSLENFGAQLPILGTAIRNFIDNIGDLGPDQIEIANSAAGIIRTLAMVAKEIPNTGGLLGDLVGNNDLGPWAAQLPIVAMGIKGFIASIGDCGEDQITIAKNAAEIIKVLAKAAQEIPNTGGLLADLIGDNDLSVWAAQLPNVALGIRGFITNLGECSDDQIVTAKNAAEIIKVLAKASEEIPNEGGWLAAIIGDNALSTWSTQLPNVATGINGFITNLGECTPVQATVAKNAAEIIKTLAAVSKNIPNEGGWLAKIVGDNSLGTWSSKLPAVGEGVKGFTDKVNGLTNQQVSSVNAAVDVIEVLSALGKDDMKKAISNIPNFGDKITGVGSDIASFCSTMSSIGSFTISSASGQIMTLINSLKNLSLVDTNTLDNFSSSLGTLGTDGIKKFANAFSNGSAKATIGSAIGSFIQGAVESVWGYARHLYTAVSDMAKNAATYVKTPENYDKFKSAGWYLVQGFAEGIEVYTYISDAKSKAMAESAYKIAKETLAVNSPSKVFRELGTSVPEGFAMGIGMLGSSVKSSVVGMADTAISGTKDAIARIANVIDSDIDAQPTIRPVLDLSDVSAGASTINSMFGLRPSVGVLSNVGAISSMMNNSQNGTNADVISAIKDLGKKFDSSSGNTYQINGISYSEDSDVSDAIRTLVKAAKIERRT